MKNGDMPAAPVECVWPENGAPYGKQTGGQLGWATGLTKRELFAAMAMQGFAADPNTATAGLTSVAEAAVCWADALLAALEATPLSAAQQAEEAQTRG